ncbi:hypothetical protein Plhal304r1_c040g0118541 [Plasmopara halstedii]
MTWTIQAHMHLYSFRLGHTSNAFVNPIKFHILLPSISPYSLRGKKTFRRLRQVVESPFHRLILRLEVRQCQTSRSTSLISVKYFFYYIRDLRRKRTTFRFALTRSTSSQPNIASFLFSWLTSS